MKLGDGRLDEGNRKALLIVCGIILALVLMLGPVLLRHANEFNRLQQEKQTHVR